ncbi:hypothetical protein AMTRI_Chr07g25470 [Amborella trichopoda]
MSLILGRLFHAVSIKFVIGFSVFVGNIVIDMYVKWFCMEDAKKFLDVMPERSIVSWTSVVAGYTRDGDNLKGLELLTRMVREVHRPDQPVLRLNEAKRLFSLMPEKNVVSWTAMIVGYVCHGDAVDALDLFLKMRLIGIKGDEYTASAILRACSMAVALEPWKQGHGDILKGGLELDVLATNALIDMYGKCGDILSARDVFLEEKEPDLASWNAMICWIRPACHGGLVEEGLAYFRMMTKKYKITSTEEHYSCMVDLFGRAGLLVEALRFIREMDVKPGDSVWGASLGACRIQGNIRVAERVANELMELMPENQYICLANIYAAAGRWRDVGFVRKKMAVKDIKKVARCSWIH